MTSGGSNQIPQWKQIETPIENIPTVETVPDEYDEDAGIAPFDHGTPADANKTPAAITTNAATTTTTNQVNEHVLHEMKHLGGWFNPMVLEYIACSKKNEKLSDQ